MTTLFRRSRILFTVALLALMGSAMATVDLPCRHEGTTNVRVTDTDLDLTAYSGMFTLYQRMQDAAMAICDPGGAQRVLPIFGLASSGDCYSTTLQSALTAYDSSFLNNIHRKVLETPILVGFGDME